MSKPELKPCPNVTIKLGRENYRKLHDAYDEWVRSSTRPFNRLSFGLFCFLRLSTGEQEVYFLTNDETEILHRAVRKIIKNRRVK